MRRSGVVLAALLAVLAACGQEPSADQAGVLCTAKGASHGIGVEVPAAVAPIRGLKLTYCVGTTCRSHRILLADGTAGGAATCDGDVCSGSMTPDGTQYGFWETKIPAGPIEVSGSYGVGDGATTLEQTTVTADLTYPNGPGCGSDGVQAQVTVGRDGLS